MLKIELDGKTQFFRDFNELAEEIKRRMGPDTYEAMLEAMKPFDEGEP